MDCQFVEEHIFDFLTDRIGSVQKHDLEDHLGRCEKCRNKVSESKYLLTTLDSIKPDKLPKNFAQQVMSDINATEKIASSQQSINNEIVQNLITFLGKVFQPAPAFVTVLVVVALVSLFYNHQSNITPERHITRQNEIYIPTPIQILATDIDLGRQKIIKAVESSGGIIEYQEPLGPDTWRFDIQIPSQLKSKLINSLKDRDFLFDEEKISYDNDTMIIILAEKK